MTKSELTERLARKHPHLQHKDVERVVASVFDTISAALAAGKRVELRGFATFTTRHREARIGRNPRTGEQVPVEEKRVPAFKPGKALREKLTISD